MRCQFLIYGFGNALDGGRFRMNVTTDSTAPGFEPIPPAVPEPQPTILLLIGLAGIIAFTRRTRPIAAKRSSRDAG